MKKPGIFLTTFFLLLLPTLAGLALLNYAVDAFDIFATERTRFFNAEKLADNKFFASNFQKYNLLNLRATRAVLGNSKTANLDRRHSIFKQQPVISLSLGNSHLKTILKTFYRLKNRREVATIYLGLDYFMFYLPPKIAYKEKISQISISEYSFRQTMVEQWFDLLFSFNSLHSSLQTIGHNQSLKTRDNQRVFKKIEGYYVTALKPGRDELASLAQENFAAYQTFLRNAYRRGINVKMMCFPHHARILELFFLTENEQSLADWFVKIAEINRAEAEAAGRAPYPVYNFCDYNDITMQNTDQNTLWIDGAHYDPELTDTMLSIIETNQPKQGFGRLLNENTRENWAAMLKRHRLYQQQNPQVIEELRSTIARLY